jgi:hypothetical protein
MMSVALSESKVHDIVQGRFSLKERVMNIAVGNASALVTFICVLCTLCTQISRSICNFTHYINT